MMRGDFCMNYEGLSNFKNQVAEPRMQRLLDEIIVPDGLCCIDNLKICFLDGRSFGTDYYINASGLIYKDGNVERYSFDEYDVSVSEFVQMHKYCIFISDGKLCLENELVELNINCTIRDMSFFTSFFPLEYEKTNKLIICSDFLPFVKMKDLFKKANIENKIAEVKGRVKEAPSGANEKELEI